MAIEHRNESREETINEKVSIIFTPCWESESAWEEVDLKVRNEDTEEKIKLGSYFIDSVAGERSWVEYDSKYVVFFGGNKYQAITYVKKIYDIEKREFVSGSIRELTEYYMKACSPNSQHKTLIKVTQSSNS